MYDHPDATPQQLNARRSRSPRNLEPVLRTCIHKRDVILLGVYSHMINYFLYLPDYPIGHLIAHQVEGR